MRSRTVAGVWPLSATLMIAVAMLAGCAADQGSLATSAVPPSVSPRGNPSPGPDGDDTPQSEAAASVEEATAASTATGVSGASTAAPTPAATPAASPAVGSAATTAATEPTAPTATSPATPPQAPTAAQQPTSAPAQAAPDLSALELTLAPVAQGLSNPLFVTHAGDGSGRLFVVEKTGAIRIIDDGNLVDSPFLDIADRVGSSGSEQGLLGLAFPPDYPARKFFFVNYTDRNGDTVIGRYNVTDDPNVADPGSEFVALTFDQPARNHNGGGLVFGPDGYLWIGTGDGGGAGDQFGNGQNPDTVLGKMLRIDVTSDASKPYLIPPDNPSAAQGWNVRPEIWAIGLRNPWRYSFDPATGDLWIADVGQNRFEEVDVIRAGSKGGLNFGWPMMEGPDCFRGANCNKEGLIMPVASYEHGADGCSITGGFVYRGNQHPALAGMYLYGDYCSGRIWGLDAAQPGEPRLLFEAGAGLSSFGEDEAGEMYVTDLGRGTVRRVSLE